MNPKEYTYFLLKSAVCLMGCDGEIHPSEIDELKTIGKNSSYFDLINFEDELEILYREIAEEGKQYIYDYYRELESINIELSEENELILLEVLLKITYADEKVDDNELTFLGMIRPRLKVTDDKIMKQFGADQSGILFIEKKEAEINSTPNILVDKPDISDISLSESINIDTKKIDKD